MIGWRCAAVQLVQKTGQIIERGFCKIKDYYCQWYICAFKEMVAVAVGVDMQCVRWDCVYGISYDGDSLLRHVYNTVRHGKCFLWAGD